VAKARVYTNERPFFSRKRNGTETKRTIPGWRGCLFLSKTRRFGE
jgi:hypothetical protein